MSTELETRVQSEVAELGTRIHELRMGRGWTLEELAKRAGLSKSYLSRLEDGERQPSIAALLSLSQAFGLTLATLFELEPPAALCTVVRAEGATERQGNGLRYMPLSSRADASGMHPILVTCACGPRWATSSTGMRARNGCTFFRGPCACRWPKTSHDLAPGDAAHFDARVPHRLAALGGQDVRLILVACTAPENLLGSYL